MNKIRLAIIDDHSLIRQGLKQIIELDGEIEVVAQGCNGYEAIEIYKLYKPDVMLLDINMKDLNGVEALKIIKSDHPECRVIMLTIHSDIEYMNETISIGAEGYILKDAEIDELVKGIKQVFMGGTYVHQSIKEIFKSSDHLSNHCKSYELLTEREKEVLSLISNGLSNRSIADKLVISEKTVKNHVSSILKKIDANDRTQAAIYALKNIKI